MTRYIIIVIFCAAVALFDTVKRSRAEGGFFSSAIGGVAGLFALDMIPVLGALVSANIFSVAVCAVFGIPGLVSLLFMQMLCCI